MTRYHQSSRRDITIEKELRCYPPDARARFVRDPATWLPGRITMHGASAFRARMPLLGTSLEVELAVGTPWTRGTSTTRRLRVDFPDPPLGMAWVLPIVDGDLSVLGEQRFRLCFEGAAVGARRLAVRRLSAAWVMRRVTAGIVERLTDTTPSLVHR